MFNLFGRKTAKEFIEEARETYSVPEVKPISVPKPKVKEHYRVGVDDEGNTTLTLIGNDGYSMTLTMNQAGFDQMIRMIRATYVEEESMENAE